MNRRVAFLVLLFSITLLSCRDESYRVLNNIVVYRDSLKVINDSITIPISKILNGNYSLKVGGNLYKSGVLYESQNVGEWNYTIRSVNDKSRNTSIVWKRHNYNNYNCKLSVPSKWTKISNIDSSYICIFNLLPNQDRSIIETDFLVVKRQIKKGKTLKGYNNYYNKSTLKSNKVMISDNYIISINSKKIGYFNRYALLDGNYNLFVVNYNFEDNIYVYDVTLKTNDNDTELSQLVFFEVLRSLSFNNEVVLSRNGILDISILE